MSRHCVKFYGACLVVLWMVGAAAAASYDDALLAYNKGDFPTALRQFRSLAERGDTRSQDALGRMYARGEGVPKDRNEAEKWFKMSSEQSDAFMSYNHGDFETALRVYRPLAEKGQVLAQYILGLMYANGHGVPESYPEGLKWLTKAAEQGEAKAQFSVGVIYFKGLGMAKNYAEAFKWYKRAADQGNATAQYNLGAMYAKGQTVPQDLVTAHMLYTLAAAQGVRAAGAAKEQLAKSMSAEQIAQANKMAKDWKPKPEVE